jgi:hypothetical protein
MTGFLLRVCHSWTRPSRAEIGCEGQTPRDPAAKPHGTGNARLHGSELIRVSRNLPLADKLDKLPYGAGPTAPQGPPGGPTGGPK